MNEVLLSDFIKTTIVEIAKGVEEAKKELEGFDVHINPHIGNAGYVADEESQGFRKTQNVDFDLMISAESVESKENNSKKEIGMRVVSILNIGGGTKRTNIETSQNTLVNRVQFSIPISLKPSTERRETSGRFTVTSL